MLTLRLLNKSAMARVLGFFQGAKNTGLVVGYIIGPAFFHHAPTPAGGLGLAATLSAEASTAGNFQHICIVLIVASFVSIGASVVLRWPLRYSAETTALVNNDGNNRGGSYGSAGGLGSGGGGGGGDDEDKSRGGPREEGGDGDGGPLMLSARHNTRLRGSVTRVTSVSQ